MVLAKRHLRVNGAESPEINSHIYINSNQVFYKYANLTQWRRVFQQMVQEKNEVSIHQN